MRLRVFAALALAAVLAGGAAASASAAPVLRTPGFGGVAKRIATAPATAPPPLVLSSDGTRPDVMVDAAGTAHIVWNQGRSGAPDVTWYCRLPRAAGACDVTHQLIPPGADQYAADAAGPEVLAVNDQVAILSHRYPQTVEKPGADRSEDDNTLYLWTSDDGGQTFVEPGVVGTGSVGGGATAFGDPQNPSIGAVTGIVTGGVTFTGVQGGRFLFHGAKLADGDFVEARIAASNGVPSVVYQDLGTTSFVRTWSGSGDVNDPATWGPPAAFPGTEPELTVAGGRLVMVNEQADGRLLLRDLASGSAVPVNRGTAGNAAIPLGRPDGTLGLVWQGTEGLTSGIWRRDPVTPGVAPRGAPALVSTEPGLFMEAGAAEDGGGVSVVETGDRRILLSAFGTRAPTGRPGLGRRAGGGALPADVAVACQKIAIGPVQAMLQDGCFLAAQKGSVKVSEGPLRLNGLEIIPDAGVQVQIDPRARTISSTGTVSVLLRAPGIPDITLFRGTLRLDLKGKGLGASLMSFTDRLFKPNLLGFPVKGEIDVRITAQGVRIPVSLQLPVALGSVRGAAELVADNRRGLAIDSLDFAADGIPLGPAALRRLQVQYRATGGTTVGNCLRPPSSGATALPNEWAGVFELELPPPRTGPAVCGSIRFGGGAFRGATFRIDLPYPGIVLFPGVSLTSLGGGLSLTPAEVAATARIQAIAAGQGASLVTLDGSLTARLANPFTLRGQVKTTVAGVRVGDGSFTFSSDGYAALQVRAGMEVGSVAVRSVIAGFVDGPRGQFSLSGKGEACIAGACLSGSEAVVSTKGVALCLPSVPRGAGYRWGESLPGGVDVWPLTCYAERYAVADARQAQLMAREHGVPEAGADIAGTAGVTFRVRGEGGVPDVDLIGPSGAPVTPDAATPDATSGTLYLGLAKGIPGRWTVRVRAGGPPIADLAVSREVTPPSVTGVRVTGRGRARVLRYRAKVADGQAITFVERGRAGTRVLGTARAGARTLAFTPAPGPGGTRRIVALLAQDELVREEVAVARYTAPPPLRAARPAALRVRRSGTRAIVTWRPGAVASAQRAVITISGGRIVARYLGPRAARLVIPRVGKGTRITASVLGVARDGRAGPRARVLTRLR